MIERIKKLIQQMNEAGVPLPMIRVDGKASLTATFAFLSFNTALLGQIGKVAGYLQGIDLVNANYLFLMTLGAYLGRRLQDDPKKQPTLQKEDQSDDEK